MMHRTIEMAAGLIMACALAVAAGEPHATSKVKPQYERLLQGDDAKLAEELTKQSALAGAADKYDEAVTHCERLLVIRVTEQGTDHWQTIDEQWVLDRLKKLRALPPFDREGYRRAVTSTHAA